MKIETKFKNFVKHINEGRSNSYENKPTEFEINLDGDVYYVEAEVEIEISYQDPNIYDSHTQGWLKDMKSINVWKNGKKIKPTEELKNKIIENIKNETDGAGEAVGVINDIINNIIKDGRREHERWMIYNDYDPHYDPREQDEEVLDWSRDEPGPGDFMAYQGEDEDE